MSEQKSIPQHVAIIPDGNRRWAKQQGLPTLQGHKRGAVVLRDVSLYAFDQGVKIVTAYIFSTENWSRSKDEVDYLMKLVPAVFEKYIADFKKREVRIHWLGSRDGLSAQCLKIVERAVEETKHFTKGDFGLCFNYGGRQEIIDAVRNLIAQHPEEITEETFQSALYAPELPDVDLLVRTSGEQRISNFQLWQTAYAELVFIDKYWPSMTTDDIDDVLHEYQQRQRRHGG